MTRSFFCNLTAQTFAAGYRDRSEPRLSVSQNNDLAFRLYLLQSLSSGSWPFAYDSWSGDSNMTAILSLRDVWSYPVITLASSEPCTVIPNGFSGLLHTNTQEAADFLGQSGPGPNRAEREAMFMVDLIDASGAKLNPFRRPVTLQAVAALGNVPSALGAVYYFQEVNTYLGSGAEALQAKPTVGRVGAVFEAWISGFVVWRVESGTAETNLDEGIIKPNDFDADTNPVNLIRGLGI